MNLHASIIKILQKKYEPSALISLKYKGNDLVTKTDENGNPVLLFVGKKTDNGKIAGKRYVRTLIFNKENVIIKDHWDLKGKATG